MRNSFQLSELPGCKEGECIFDVRCPDRVVAQLFGSVLAQAQALTRQPQIGVPLHPAVTPVLIPAVRRRGVAKELDLHLLEFARAKSEIARGDLVPEALSNLRYPQRDSDARAAEDILEVHENALGGFGPQEGRTLLVGQRADVGLEDQIESARLGQRSERFGVGTQDTRAVLHLDQGKRLAVPLELIRVLFAKVEKLQSAPSSILLLLVRLGGRCHEDSLALGFHPAAAHLVVSVAAFGFTTVNHEVGKQVIVPRTLPDLRMHDDRGVDPGHGIGLGSPLGRTSTRYGG